MSNENTSSRYLDGLDLSRLPEEAAPVLIALGQFKDGEPVAAVCSKCHQSITVEPLGNPTCAWAHSCPCGTCNGSLRGF
nr:orf79EGC144 [uncultured bacterium]